MPQKCKVAKGGFKIFTRKKSSPDEESQVVAESGEGEIDKSQLRESFSEFIEASMSPGGSLSSSVPGIVSLHYIGKQSISASISSSDQVVTLNDANNTKLYLSLTGVFLAMVSMVAIGTLMKRNRRGHAVKDNENNDTVGLTSGSGSAASFYNESSSHWNKGWENVTQAYDNAVEVCVKRVDSFRRGSERVDNVRRERNEFVSI